jgi:hypothetical protein
MLEDKFQRNFFSPHYFFFYNIWTFEAGSFALENTENLLLVTGKYLKNSLNPGRNF